LIDGAKGDSQLPVVLIIPLLLFIHQPLGVMPQIHLSNQIDFFLQKRALLGQQSTCFGYEEANLLYHDLWSVSC